MAASVVEVSPRGGVALLAVWYKLGAETESSASRGAPERTKQRTKKVPSSGTKYELKTGTKYELKTGTQPVHSYNYDTISWTLKQEPKWYPFVGIVLVPIFGYRFGTHSWQKSPQSLLRNWDPNPFQILLWPKRCESGRKLAETKPPALV